AARREVLRVIGDRAHVLVARREVDAHEALGVSDRTLPAQPVPDRERVVDPGRIEVVEVGGPVLDRRTLAHGAPPSGLDDFDGELGTIGFGEVGLLLEARWHGAVALLAGVAVLVELEELRCQRLAAVVTLAFLAIDANLERAGIGHAFTLPLYERAGRVRRPLPIRQFGAGGRRRQYEKS